MRLVNPVFVALVDGERRLPVRGHRDQPQVPRRGEQLRPDEARHGVPAGEPRQERRHLQDGVRAQELGQRAGIGALDGHREPFQHGPLLRVVRLGELVLGGHRLRELGPGATEAAVDRRGRRAQQLRHLGGRPLQHVPQDQHRALPGGQVLQRRDERQPDTRPRGRDGRRVLPVLGDPHVGERLQPRHLRRCLQRRLRVVGRPAQTGRQRPAAAPLDRGQTHIGRDPIQPSPHRRPALEPLVRPPRPQERLLDQVLGLIHRTQQSVAVSQQLTAEPAGQTGEVLADRHQPLQLVPPTSDALALYL